MSIKKLRRFAVLGAAVTVAITVTATLINASSASALVATGTVTCSHASGGIQMIPPAQSPEPYGPGGPVASDDRFEIELGGCVDSAGLITWSGLNNDPAIDGIFVGQITPPWNVGESLTATPTYGATYSGTIHWYGEESGSPIAPTVVKGKGIQDYFGITAPYTNNIAYFLGSTGSSCVACTYGSPPQGPAGMQSFLTENLATIGPGSYAWQSGNPSIAIGGQVTFSATPSVLSGSTNTVCLSTAALGTYGYTPDVGQGYQFAQSGLLQAVRGDLIEDPVSPYGGYVTAFSATPPTTVCPAGDASITFHLANVPGGSLPISFTLGLPLVVDSPPAVMSALATSNYLCPTTANDQIQLGVTDPDTISASPSFSVCALRDGGAYNIPGGVGRQALWVYGTVPSGSSIPSASYGFALADCVTPGLGSCDLGLASGSFSNTGVSVVEGDLVTPFVSRSDLVLSANGALDGYDNPASPDPDGASYIAVSATDGLTF